MTYIFYIRVEVMTQAFWAMLGGCNTHSLEHISTPQPAGNPLKTTFTFPLLLGGGLDPRYNSRIVTPPCHPCRENCSILKLKASRDNGGSLLRPTSLRRVALEGLPLDS